MLNISNVSELVGVVLGSGKPSWTSGMSAWSVMLSCVWDFC